jgi:transposase
MGGVKMNLVELVKGSFPKEEADDRCPFCEYQKIGSKKSLFECYGCRKEWSIRKDSMLEGLKVSLTKFIWLLNSLS